MSDESALETLIRRARDPAESSETIGEAIGPAFAPLTHKGRAEVEAVIRRLAEEIVDAPTRPDVAGTIALCCGALVERGLSPTIAIEPILDRLEDQIAPDALAFVEACRQAADDDPEPAPADSDAEDPDNAQRPDPTEIHGERLAELMPTESRAFRALEPFSLAAIAMLSRSIDARKAARSRARLRDALDELGGQYGHAGFLWIMMQVLDDEPLLVLHPGQARGYQVRISGLADNFQLHTLLAHALIGRISPRWLRGRRPSAAEVAAAKGGPCTEGGPPAQGAFNLWTWRGLKPDGTLPDAMSGSSHWVWNEGVPADIPRFEETRVVLLGPPPYERTWSLGRKFTGMTGDLRVEHVLSAAETRDWLQRIAAASAAAE